MSESATPVLRFRQSPRIPFGAPVELGRGDGADPVRARIEDLSAEGMLVRGERPGRPGERLALRFEAQEEQISGIGELVWVRRPTIPGEKDFAAGIHFSSLSPGAHEIITDIVTEHRAAKAKGGVRHAAEVSAEPVAQSRPATPDSLTASDRYTDVSHRSLLRRSSWALLIGALVAVAILAIRLTRGDQEAAEATEVSEQPALSVAVDVAPNAGPERAVPPPSPAVPVDTSLKITETGFETPLGARHILRIEPLATDDETIIRVVADGVFGDDSLSGLLLDDAPPRYLLRIDGIQERFGPAVRPIVSEHLLRLRTALHDTDNGPQLHLVLDLTEREIDVEIRASGEEIVLSLRATRP